MADFYIRSWDPASTYPPNPQEGDVCYTITLDQSWSPVAGVKNDNLLKEEIYTNGQWVEQGGGGGSTLTTLYENASVEMVEDGGGVYENDEQMDLSCPLLELPGEIIVTFNGTTYTMEKQNENGDEWYGAPWFDELPDFTEYPLGIYILGDDQYDYMNIYTEAETVAIKVEMDPNADPNSYTTCTVSVTGDITISSNILSVPYIDNSLLKTIVIAESGQTNEYEVVLCNGSVVGFTKNTTADVKLTGDATKSYDGSLAGTFITITGDCSITIGSNK